MQEEEVFTIPNTQHIHHLYIDGVLLHVSCDDGLKVLSINPWKCEKIVQSLTSVCRLDDTWKNKCSKFNFDFKNAKPSHQLVNFINICTTDKVKSPFKNKHIVDTLLNMYNYSPKIVGPCIQRILNANKVEPNFTCAICKSSHVDEEDHKLGIIVTCLHRFHYSCLQRFIDSIPGFNSFTMENWALEAQLKCPICRSGFKKEDFKPDPTSTKQCIYSSDDSDNENDTG